MARCLSIDVLEEMKLDGEMREVESSSDSDVDISSDLDQDVCKENYNQSSNSVEIISSEECVQLAYPVLSLKCLHDDATNEIFNHKSSEREKEENYSSRNHAEIEFVDINDVPELFINSDEEENRNKVFNHKTSKEKKEESNSSMNGVKSNSTKSKVELIHVNDLSKSSINNHQEEKRDKILNHKSSEQEDEEHPHLVPLIISSSSSRHKVAHSYSSLPARNNWEGPHSFKIKIDCPPKSRKNDHIIFSEEENKLYVIKDYPFKVLVTAENVPADSLIRVSAAFSLLEHSTEVVQRCPTHAQQDFNKGIPYYEHFVQCFSDAAVYGKDHKTGNLSVCVLYKEPQEGEMYSAYSFKLTCFNSCSGGINRRPFMLIFTLEKEDVLLGRQVIEAKVCACPLRDYKLEMVKKNKILSRQDISNDSRGSSESNPEKIKLYSISVKDPELYLFLENMKCLYETSASPLMMYAKAFKEK